MQWTSEAGNLIDINPFKMDKDVSVHNRYVKVEKFIHNIN